MAALPITGSDDADRLLEEQPLALMIGMMLDQQMTMEVAFRGPSTLIGRLGHLNPGEIAAMDDEEFINACSEKPAIHRFPRSMGERVKTLATIVASEHDGDAASIWTTADTAAELKKRLRAIPGFGEEKTKIFIALLAKRFDVQPAGWQTVCAPYGDDQPRSVADVHDAESLMRVREHKRAAKALKKAATTT